MQMEAILVLLVVSAFLALTLKAQKPELSLLLSIAAGALAMIAVVQQLAPVLTTVGNMFSDAGVSGKYVSVAAKGLGVCLVTQLAADTCKDAGESGLSAKAETVGKVVLLVLTLPLFRDIQQIITTMLTK